MSKLEDDPKIQATLAELRALIAKLPEDRKRVLDDYLTAQSRKEDTIDGPKKE